MISSLTWLFSLNDTLVLFHKKEISAHVLLSCSQAEYKKMNTFLIVFNALYACIINARFL